MVTTGVVEIATVGAVASGQNAQSGGDNSPFAQLLGETVTDAAMNVPGIPAKTGSKSVNVAADTSIVPTDVLALCGMPVPAPAPSAAAMPAAEVATKSEQQSDDAATPTDAALQALTGNESAARAVAAQMPVPQAPQASTSTNTNANDDSSDTALLADDSRTTRAADLRWLNSGVHQVKANVPTSTGVNTEDATTLDAQVAPLPAQSEQQSVMQSVEKFAGHSATPAAASTQQNIAEQAGNTVQRPEITGRDIANAASHNVAVKLESAASEQQPAFQKLMSQVTPLMNMIAGQSRDNGVNQSVRDATFTDAQNPLGALHAASLQPAGTQLARDVPALDVTPRHQLHSTVGSQQWATELGDKLTMMAARDTQSATLYMTPADMGPVQVRIELNQDQASVWFTAEHAETRSALEQSLPKLREMFSAQGMSLTDAGVFGDRSRQQQPEGNFASNRFAGFQYEDSEVLADTAAVRTISLGLLDAYA